MLFTRGTFFLIAFSFLVLFFACVRPAGAEDSVKVGVVLPLTGPQAFFGEIEKNAFDMAIEEINAAGPIRGKKLEFVIADDQSRPDIGVAVAEKLIDQDKVVMLTGGYSSSVSAKIAELAQKKRIPFLINTGSSDAITEHGWEYVFRLNPPASEYVSSAINFLTQIVKPQTVAVIFEDSAFGQSQSESFERACERVGIQTIVKESYDAAYFPLWRISQILLKIKRTRPDVVYMISYLMDASILMRQAEALKWTPKLYLGGGAGFTLPAFYELTQYAAEKVMTVTLWDPSLPYPGATDFANAFRNKYNVDTDYHGAEAYAAAYVVADVLQRAKSHNADDIREALSETRMMTAFGPVEFVTFGNKTNQNNLGTYLAQWIDGKLELVWPENLATAKYVYPLPAGN